MTRAVQLTRPQRVFRFVALLVLTTYEALHTALAHVVQQLNEQRDQARTITVPAWLTVDHWTAWAEEALADLPRQEDQDDDRT